MPPILASVPRNPDCPRQIHRFPCLRVSDFSGNRKGVRGEVSASAQLSTPFAFTSSYTEYGDKQVYEEREGKMCDGSAFFSFANLTNAIVAPNRQIL